MQNYEYLFGFDGDGALFTVIFLPGEVLTAGGIRTFIGLWDYF